MRVCPREISFSYINKVNSLSPSNYSKTDILNTCQVEYAEYLDSDIPYNTGIEPGSSAYVPKSNIQYIRNSCIDVYNYRTQHTKNLYLNPNYQYNSVIDNEDVLLCKDANIGQTGVFLKETDAIYIYSSGILKLNFVSEEMKYYCLAFMRDEYFFNQLDTLTPKGSTIRHSGDNFLKCKIPEITKSVTAVLPVIKKLIRNICYSEMFSNEKMLKAIKLFAEELQCEGFQYSEPNINTILSVHRLDAGYYSEIVESCDYSVRNYKNGYTSIEGYGYSIRRGPNLAKRDLGRSKKSKIFKKGYHTLVYPSDISDSGYILKSIYLGARNPVWFLKERDILFSAEGTVGKVFAICNDKIKFTTNFHGIIITPKLKTITIDKSIVLALYLNYLRAIDYLNHISVGGQGGSLAVNYFDKIKIPKFPTSFRAVVSQLYHNDTQLSPIIFNSEVLTKAGVFELNQFRVVCSEVLNRIVSDIKNNTVKSPHEYEVYSEMLV